jgi:predicted N-acetyltransferase YhbS
MKVTYAREERVNPQEVIEVFKSSGIRRPVDQPERISKMLKFANLTICARDNGKLVGIARALTDFSFCCYLSDLAVRKEYQRLGLGKELIKKVQEAIGDETMLLLLSAPEADSYYPHIGFEKVNNAWQIPRKR